MSVMCNSIYRVEDFLEIFSDHIQIFSCGKLNDWITFFFFV
jgi:hypothetical protein